MSNVTKYDKITKKYQKELINSLSSFVAINSVYDGATVSKANPFGKGVSNALEFFTKLAKKDGFTVTNYDNKVVEVVAGEGKKNITIMAHADVVPAGTGWENDPFKMVEKKGVLYGRGVADDKGPLLASYYALKAIRDHHLLGNYQVRFLVGGNEESGSLCMEHYFHKLKKPMPTLGFSPDSDFPLIFAEKGIINFEITKRCKLKNLISIEGGVASNSVIEKCTVLMDFDEDFIRYIADHYHRVEAEIHTKDDKTEVIFYGKAAHGSTPELGVNAGIKALTAIGQYSGNEELLSLIKKLTPVDAKGINAHATNKEMGHNSLNVGLVNYRDGVFSFTCNYRYINTVKSQTMINNIKKEVAPASVKVLAEAPLLYFSKKSPLITSLLKAYRDETGDKKSQPLSTGGGTYAKEADNVVAFGMQFPGWNSNMHSPGEAVRKADLFKAMSVYMRAILYLGDIVNEN